MSYPISMFRSAFPPFLACGVVAAALMLAPVGQMVDPWLYYDLPFVTIAALVLIGLASVWFGNSDVGWRFADLGQAILIAAFFGLALSLLSQQLLHTRWVVWGLFQLNDASDFLNSSIKYLIEGSFITPRGRVVSNLLYAGLLDVTKFDLRESMWIITSITMMSTLALAGVLTRCMGVGVGLVGTFVLLQFAYEHIGGTTTELPGLAFGLSATALLIFGARNGRPAAVICGYAILCLAMITRIGAALVLPGVLIWSIFFLPPLFGRRWMVAVVGLAITVLVLIGNSTLTKQISPQSGGSFVNAIDSWYAVIVEGQLLLNQRSEDSVIPVTRWVQIYNDHPELTTLPMAERPQKKQEILFAALKNSPAAAIAGSVQEIVRYVGDFLMFRFVEIKPAKILLTFLALVGVSSALISARRVKDPVGGLLVISSVALLFSQPFLYGGESRVPAPTVGLLAALAGLGWIACSKAVRRRFAKASDPRTLLGRGGEGVFAWVALIPMLALVAVIAMGFVAGGTWRASMPASLGAGACGAWCRVCADDRQGKRRLVHHDRWRRRAFL